jgi:lipoate-protein ligase A
MIRQIVNLTPGLPPQQLALEEALLESAQLRGQDTLRIWINDRAIVIGRSQSAALETDLNRARDLKIPVIRRISGGGTVYHYPGNLNISLYLSDGRWLGGVEEVFSQLGEVFAASLSHLGIKPRLKKNGLFIGKKKVAGAAQARRGNSLAYHSTLLLEPSDGLMSELLSAMQPDYTPSIVPSQPHPTTTLTESIPGTLHPEVVIQAISRELAGRLTRSLVPGKLRSEEINRSMELTRLKYGSPNWNQYR